MSLQQSDQLEAWQAMRFGVDELAGLVVKSGRPAFRSTFRTESMKAIKIAPFRGVGAEQARQNFIAIKAQVRAIVGGEVGPV